MFFPNGPVLAPNGIKELVLRIISLSQKRRTGPLLRRLVEDARQVLLNRGELESRSLLAKLAAAEQQARTMERGIPALTTAQAATTKQLIDGITNMTRGVRGARPSLTRQLTLMSEIIGNQADVIGMVQSDTQARRILANIVEAPFSGTQANVANTQQTQASRCFLNLVEEGADALEAGLVEGAQRGGLTIDENIEVSDVVVMISDAAAAAGGQITRIPRLPTIEDLVVDAASQIPPERNEVATAFQLFSPNVAEDLQLDDAVRLLAGPDQARLSSISKDVDGQLALSTEQRAAVADSAAGAENTFFTRFLAPPDFPTIRYSAAWKGLIANQKSVIPFIAELGGPDSLYRVQTTVKDLAALSRQLQEVGIESRTLVPNEDGTLVVVFDQGTRLLDNISAFGSLHGESVQQVRGRGEFLGGDTRTEGRRAFQRVIDEFEAGRGRRRYRPLPGPGVPGLEPTPAGLPGVVPAGPPIPVRESAVRRILDDVLQERSALASGAVVAGAGAVAAGPPITEIPPTT